MNGATFCVYVGRAWCEREDFEEASKEVCDPMSSNFYAALFFFGALALADKLPYDRHTNHIKPGT